MGERRAYRDTLLLAAGELPGTRVAFLFESDPLEKFDGAQVALPTRRAGERRLERNELAGGEVRIERARVVLLDETQASRAVISQRTSTELPKLRAEDADSSR